MKNQEKMTIRAVYDKDIEKLLGNLGFLTEIKSAQCNCHFCSEIISLENFAGIIRINGKLEIFCDRIECYLKMLKKRKNR